MSRTYTPFRCFHCGATVSSAGAARTSHYRKHVREGILIELEVAPWAKRQGIKSGTTFVAPKEAERLLNTYAYYRIKK